MTRFDGYWLKRADSSGALAPLRRVIRMANATRTPLLDLDEDACVAHHP